MVRVLITGIGLVTGLGIGTEPTWQGLVDGRSAVQPLAAFDASSLRTRIGAEIRDLDTRSYVSDRRSLRNMTRNDQLAVVGAALAADDAGITLDPSAGDRAGLFLASHKEISDPTKVLDAVLSARNADGTADIGRMGSEGADKFYPLFYVEGLQAAALFYVSKQLGLRGPNTYFSGSSDAGITAIGRAFRAIRRGEADLAVAGAFDDATSWWNASRLDQFGILSARNELGATACRPYDVDRDGAVLGEGAAFFVLESAESATRRGVGGYAEVSGFGSRFDPSGLFGPSPDGSAMTGAIGAALDEGQVPTESVDLLVAEGMSTQAHDASEAAAIRSALGASSATVAATSIKPATGHLIAAAGAMNAAVAALAIRHGVVPAMTNLARVDPECSGIGWVTQSARTMDVRHAVAVGQGMEGQNNALLLRALEGKEAKC